MELNPHHPGWYRFAAFNRALHGRDFATAMAVAKRFNMPSYFYTHFALATAAGHLGDRATARQALTELLLEGRFRAGIDVYPQEPLPQGHPIRRAEHAVLSSHRAGAMHEAIRNIGRLVARRLSGFDCRLLGYDPVKTFHGRAVLEAASMEVELDPEDVALVGHTRRGMLLRGGEFRDDEEERRRRDRKRDAPQDANDGFECGHQ